MERRGFLRAMLAAGMAPAVVKAASLMPVRALPSGLFVPGYVALGNTFITPAMLAAEAVRILYENISLASDINRNYDEPYRQRTTKVTRLLTVADGG